jgi:hypothetical protein
VRARLTETRLQLSPFSAAALSRAQKIRVRQLPDLN